MVVRLAVFLVFGFFLPVLCRAQNQIPNTIVIKDHQFMPPSLAIPANQKVQITVDNQDPTAEEFESFDLDREQVVEGHHKITVFVGPLSPGIYKYWADYHQASQGVIVVK